MNASLRPALLLPLAVLLLAACGPGGGSATPSPSIAPTPTPVGSAVASVEEAAAIVTASDPRFSGITKLNPDLIGASAWWEGQATATGYTITITIGWGDCPAGCINRHVWNYEVTPDGNAALVSESGDPMPAGSLPA